MKMERQQLTLPDFLATTSSIFVMTKITNAVAKMDTRMVIQVNESYGVSRVKNLSLGRGGGLTNPCEI